MLKEEVVNNIAITSRVGHIKDEEFLKIIDFILSYSFKDEKEVYTNGTILVPVYRVLDAIIQKGDTYKDC